MQPWICSSELLGDHPYKIYNNNKMLIDWPVPVFIVPSFSVTLHGPLMFAVKAKIYGVLYNQASSIAFHWSPRGNLVSIGSAFRNHEGSTFTEKDRNKVNYRIGPLRSDSVIKLVSDLITESDQAVWAVHSCNSWFDDMSHDNSEVFCLDSWGRRPHILLYYFIICILVGKPRLVGEIPVGTKRRNDVLLTSQLSILFR